MTNDQRETLKTLENISSDECESMDTTFRFSESDGILVFEMFSEYVYRSGYVNLEGYVTWN